MKKKKNPVFHCCHVPRLSESPIFTLLMNFMQRPFVLSRLFYDDESLVQHLKFAGLAVPSRLPALEVQATTTPENFGKTISSTITPVDCDGKSFSAHAAENQFRKHTATEVRKELSFSLKQLFIFI